MINAPLIIDASSRIRRPIHPKAILWPTASGYGNIDGSTDSTCFPGWQAVKARKGATPASPLEAFRRATSEAQHRIFILDDYVFNPEGNGGPFQKRMDQVLKWLPIGLQAYDVRLLTKGAATPAIEADIVRQLETRAGEINKASPYRENALVIKVKFTLGSDFPYVHDRFAIVDDELWHFGATVGGFHSLVNAATRGWNVDDHGAEDFFEMAWKGEQPIEKYSALTNRSRRGRHV